MQLIDLTHPIHDGMQVYPNDPEVTLHTALNWEPDGVRVSAVRLGSHTGTHLDAPCHAIPGGRTLQRVGLEELVGEALVIHLAQPQAGQVIGLGDVAAQLAARVPRIVLLATGWDRHFGTQRYLRHPVPGSDLVAELWRRGMRVLGVDVPSPDPTLQPAGAGEFPVHQFVLGNDGLIVENLRGIAALPAGCRVGFFPLPLASPDGAPVRAVAWVGPEETATNDESRNITP